ncbi:MAG: UDP-N-acetylenolpyruvoylglucosamine reductase, partial [Proteobacteria bacterium]|nr:UDP-N-acetylenolpyruvoylglucosamine reductase [Pseudomonadota bacterium]
MMAASMSDNGLHGVLKRHEPLSKHTSWRVGGPADCFYEPAEFLAGVPGTVGGALAMNAGAFGGETWNVVTAVETMDHTGRLRTRLPSDYQIGYRSVQGPAGEWFIAGHFGLTPGNETEGQALIKSLLAKRGATQPTQWPNAGSVFRNPPGDYSARL